MSFVFDVPTRLLFGPDKIHALKDESLPGKRALLITSAGRSTIVNGSREAVTDQLQGFGIEVLLFDRIHANPSLAVVQEAVDLARSSGCDMVVGLGGGSVMDTATVVSAVAPQSRSSVWDFVKAGTGGGYDLTEAPLFCIEIATTAGTGSEVDKIGVITNEDTHEKIGLRGFFPDLAIVDPCLMLDISPRLTAYQGFDALFHNIEGYLSRSCNEGSAVVELAAVRSISRYLPAAVADGKDLQARTEVALGSLLGGYSMDLSSNTSHHSLEHAMSAYHPELPHGAGLILLSLSYFGFFIDHHACDQKFIDLARAMGRHHATEPSEFLTALRDLQEQCHVDTLKMSEHGLSAEEIPVLAENAMTAMASLFTRDPLTLSRENVVSILEDVFRLRG